MSGCDQVGRNCDSVFVRVSRLIVEDCQTDLSMKIENSHEDIALRLVDLDQYPIADLDRGAGAAFLAQCQQQMEEHGWCNLDGFIRDDALAALRDEANGLLPFARKLEVKRNIYQGAVDTSLAADDPKRQEYIHRATQLADDQIGSQTMIKRLYTSDILTDFVRRVQQKPTLYRCADEFQALNIVGLEPESWHAWHYDTTECTVTLLLQSAEEGGEFAFIPNSRTDTTEDSDRVDRLLSGDMSVAQTFSRGAGAFTLFRGGYSLHGVTKVQGARPRITAVMTYADTDDVVISDEINIRIYGERVAKILEGRRAQETENS